MLPSHKLRILVATQPVDFREGDDGLAVLVQSVLKDDPFAGAVFVFRAKRADRLKLLFWEGTGLVMAYKCLEETRFTWPPIRDGVMTLNGAQFEALFAGLDWRRVRALEARRPAAAERSAISIWRASPGRSEQHRGMLSPARIDLSAIPEDQRDAVAAVLREHGDLVGENSELKGETTSLKEIVKRLEHLVAELNHVVHGKKSEKIDADERQLAFEDLEIAVAEVEERRDSPTSSDDALRRTSVPVRRNRGNLPEDLPRMEGVIEPDSLNCTCGCGQVHRIGED